MTRSAIFITAILAAAVAHSAPMATEGFVTNKISAAIAAIPAPDFSTSNATLVATIQATAPAPGDYATVSNKAMTALQSYTETDPTIYAWAKESSKPTYTAREVKAIPYDHVDGDDVIHTTEFISFDNDVEFGPEAAINVSTNWLYFGGVRYTGVSTFPNDAGYLTSYTETDPTVPAWARAASKPTYTAAEVGAASPAAVSNIVSTVYVREKLGVWMEYDEETGIYYYCHEEE